ncbi:hypothetical protein LWI29_027924 [Acer saccharum]|uniref:Pectin acetylesterase n=1 Tax=Acer saccharum TaxID=4024 RepID=A0AA39SUI2_ACESA|nr:hypothetical protein LWI29_027924 [Acer saccharum]
MAAKKKLNSGVEIVVVLVLLTCAPSLIHSADDNRLLVNMTLVPNSTASALGAFCLDGSLPAYHLHRGFGAGARNWLLQFEGIEQNLNPNCTKSLDDPELCFFPQYALKYIETPFFVLNSAYDVFQFHHGLAPPSADKRGHWNRCSFDPAACNANQIDVLQGFRNDMLAALHSRLDGMFVNSCFAHCQSESQDTWFADDSPRIHDKTIAEAVGDWYYNRRVTKEIDCPYPCDSSCHNIIP